MFTISIFFEQEIINRPTGHRISLYNEAPDIKRLISEVVVGSFWEPIVRKDYSSAQFGSEVEDEDEDESAMLILGKLSIKAFYGY